MTFGEIWSLFKSIELTEITTGAVRSTPVADHAKHTHTAIRYAHARWHTRANRTLFVQKTTPVAADN